MNNSFVTPYGFGVLLSAEGNLQQETLAAARSLGLLERAGERASSTVARQTRQMTGVMGGFRDMLSGIPQLMASVTSGLGMFSMVRMAASVEESQARLRADLKQSTKDAALAEGQFNSLVSVIGKLEKPVDLQSLYAGMANLNDLLGYDRAKTAYPVMVDIIKSGVRDVDLVSETMAILVQQFNEVPRRIGDLLRQTSMVSGMRMDELLQFTKNQAALIASMGWSIEDTFSAIGVLGSKGRTGKQSIGMLQSLMQDVTNYLAKLREVKRGENDVIKAGLMRGGGGFEVTDKTGNFLPISKILENAARFIGYTNAQAAQHAALTPTQMAALTNANEGVFTNPTVQAFKFLIPQMHNLGDGLRNADGALKAYADDVSRNLNSNARDLSQNFKDLISQIDVFVPILKEIIEQLNKLLDWFKTFFKEYPVIGGTIDVAAMAGLGYMGYRGLKSMSGRLLGGRGAIAAGEAMVNTGSMAAAVSEAGIGTGSLAATIISILPEILGAGVVVTAVGALAGAIRDDQEAKKKHEEWLAEHTDPEAGLRFLGAQPKEWTWDQRRDFINGLGFPNPNVPDSILHPPVIQRPFSIDDFYGSPFIGPHQPGQSVTHTYDYSTPRMTIQIIQQPGETPDSLINRMIQRKDEIASQNPGGKQ